jgi:Uma2 family endonuclease
MVEPNKTEGSRFTWNDYRAWSDEKRYEIIDGELYAMTPSPTSRHQRVVHKLDRMLGEHFDGKLCQVFPAPMDLKLSESDVVQPDLFVVCDPKQNKGTHFEGPPALVVEILSPSSSLHDRGRKLQLYARSGVREVWLVTPYPSSVEVYLLDGSTYRLARFFEKDDTLTSSTFPELEITLAEVFDFPIDPGEEIQLIKEGRPDYAGAR